LHRLKKVLRLHNNHLYNIKMYLTKEVKAEIFAKHGGKAENTGKSESQIALFTFRISHLTEHLKKNRHDYNTERSLVLLVGKRRALLDYLKKTEINRYREIIKELGIRK
jgi:small subunit ribosomal protein S15